MPEAHAIAVYRIVQEMLANIVKHSNATRCGVRLQSLPERHGITVTVTDTGTGFDPTEVAGKGVGLIGMRERAMAISGELQVDPVKGEGTVVRVILSPSASEDTALT